MQIHWGKRRCCHTFCFFHPNRKPETTSTPGFTHHANRSTHQFGQLLTNGKAQTGPTVFSSRGTIPLGKGLKQFGLVLWRHADSRIDDLDPEDDFLGHVILKKHLN